MPTKQNHYRLASAERQADDLPQLQFPMQEVWKTPQRSSALPLSSVF
jgi:hypothetical protein